MTLQKVIELRHKLHAHPELSNYESNTSRIIIQFIAHYNPDEIIQGLGGHGIAAVFAMSNEGPTIMIRCELDALPIEEINEDLTYKSTLQGVSHKCGHDGHMAIVAGLAEWLETKSINTGKVILLFQPAEENGQGAERVINDIRFKSLEPDYIFALHNIPSESMHSIILMDKGFSAEVISVIIKITGQTSHAAEPEKGTNPARCLSQIITSLETLNVTDPHYDKFSILTPVHINMGEANYGISPGSGELHYTLRTWDDIHMTKLKEDINNIVQQICEQETSYTLKWLEHFPASSNNSACNSYIRQAAMENKFDLIDRPYPFKFGEDFGWYTREYKTAMFGLGAGLDTPPLHNAAYDFPDEIIPTGIAMFKTVIRSILIDGTN